MMFLDYILQWARDKGYTAVYGSPEQVNEMLTDVPFADSKDGTAVIMHLVSESETYNGHDRAIVAVYYASLCPLDFNGESLLPEQERLKNIGKALLNDIRTGNVLSYEYPRWQYGYDDYAENVAWVCLRVTVKALAADCVELNLPTYNVTEIVGMSDFLADAYELTALTGAPFAYNTKNKSEFMVVVALVSDLPMASLDMLFLGERITIEVYATVIIDAEMVVATPIVAGQEGRYFNLFVSPIIYVGLTYDVCVSLVAEYAEYSSGQYCFVMQ